MSSQLEQLLGYLERDGVTQVVIGTGRPIAMRTPNGFTNITARPLSPEQLANFMRHPDIAALVPDTDGDGDIAEVQIGRRRAVAQVRKKGHELILSLSRSENPAAPPGTLPLARVAMPKLDTEAAAPRAKSPTKIPRTKGSTYTPISTFKEAPKEAPKPPAPTALDTPTSRLPAGLTFGGAGAPAPSSPAASDFDSFSLDDAGVELGGGGATDGAGGADRTAAGRAATVDARHAGLGASHPSLDVDSLELDSSGSALESGARSFEAGGASGRGGATARRASLHDAGVPRAGAAGGSRGPDLAGARAGRPGAGLTHGSDGSAGGRGRSHDVDELDLGTPARHSAVSLDLDDAGGAHGGGASGAGELELELDGGAHTTGGRGGSHTTGGSRGGSHTAGGRAGASAVMTLDDNDAASYGAGAHSGMSLERSGGSHTAGGRASAGGGMTLDDNDPAAYGALARGGVRAGVALEVDGGSHTSGGHSGPMSLELDDDSAYGSAGATDAADRDFSLDLDDVGSRSPATRPAVAQSSASFAQRAPAAPTSTARFVSPVSGAARGASSPAISVPAVVSPAGRGASSAGISVPAAVPPVAARSTAPAASARIASGNPARADSGAFGALLRAARERGASDLHVSAARVTTVRVGGELVPLAPGAAPLSAASVSDLLLPLLDDASHVQLEKVGYVDLALEAPGGGRLRANISRQQQGLKGTFRLALAAPASLEQLGLPAELAKVVHHHQGLIIVAGPSGQGKTTTLAAFVDLLNSTKAFHILTIEDPVEIVHTRKQAVISQREAGRHTTSFARGLKASLREDPDVIVIGELRDRDSVEIALTAAETGHLVIATMSTPSASKTIDRLIDMFPPEEQNQVRASIAGALRAIVAQRLLPKRGGGVVPAIELVTGVLPLAVLIRDDKLYQLPNLLQRGRAFGMIRFDESLVELVRAGKVDEETALAFAESKKDLAAQLRPAQTQQAAQPPAKTSPLWGFGKKDPR